MSRSLIVQDPGLFATIQDMGRWGYLRYGVSNSGAMDRVSLQVANILVGNDPGEAAVEYTAVGGTYEVSADACRIAIAGGEFPITIDGEAVAAFTSHTVHRGSRIVIGAAKIGMRGYLAVLGGFDLPPTLGSLSTLVRYGLGGMEGKPLESGCHLPLRNEGVEPGEDRYLDASLIPTSAGPIRVVLGPQDDYFTDNGKKTFLSSLYTVTDQCDRMGYRLDGPEIEHSGDFNIVSDGIAPGSVQVPGTRKPIILLADRQPTGGYPKIATVITADLHRLGQMEPGRVLQFKAVSVEEAEDAYLRLNHHLETIAQSIEPLDADTLNTDRLLSVNLIDGIWN